MRFCFSMGGANSKQTYFYKEIRTGIYGLYMFYFKCYKS